jgi:hypothetical protein
MSVRRRGQVCNGGEGGRGAGVGGEECEVAGLGLGCWEGKVIALGFEIRAEGTRRGAEFAANSHGRWAGLCDVPTCFLTGCVRVTNKLPRGDSLVVSARNSVSSADAYHL